MKYFKLFILAFSILYSPVLFAADPSKEQSAAAAYFESLFGGDANAANALSAAPFSLDGKKTLMKKEEVDAAHQEIVQKKGKRPIPKYTIAKGDEAAKLDAAVFPNHVAFRVSIDTGNGNIESIDIFVVLRRDQWVVAGQSRSPRLSAWTPTLSFPQPLD